MDAPPADATSHPAGDESYEVSPWLTYPVGLVGVDLITCKTLPGWIALIGHPSKLAGPLTLP